MHKDSMKNKTYIKTNENYIFQFHHKGNVLPEPLKVTHETNHSLNTSGQDKGKQLNKTLLTIGLQYCVGCTVIL
jgi:hypothetical protein